MVRAASSEERVRVKKKKEEIAALMQQYIEADKLVLRI